MYTSVRKSTNVLVATLLAIVLYGCGINSQVTHSFVDPKVKDLNLHGVMIIAVANEKSARTEFEDAFDYINNIR